MVGLCEQEKECQMSLRNGFPVGKKTKTSNAFNDRSAEALTKVLQKASSALNLINRKLLKLPDTDIYEQQSARSLLLSKSRRANEGLKAVRAAIRRRYEL